jgi:hypothetical protein
MRVDPWGARVTVLGALMTMYSYLFTSVFLAALHFVFLLIAGVGSTARQSRNGKFKIQNSIPMFLEKLAKKTRIYEFAMQR